MSLTPEQLYALLPAVYRIRDVEQGEPLKALVNVIAEQANVIEADIAGLYENWFVETCAEWVVPYLGDLLAVRGLHPLGPDVPFSQRAFVANALRYRRRKGTASVLEQLARDITGWNARAVEFFELLETTQHYNHVRLHNLRTPDLRRTNELELVDTAFDVAAHTGDVRSIKLGRGWHNIPNVGIFIWRLQSYSVPRSSARPVVSPADGRYTFSPLGLSSPLFNRPQTEKEITHLAEEFNVPGLLRRRPLYDELEARRQNLVDGGKPVATYFGKQPVLQIFVQTNPGDPFVEVPAEEILICNLDQPPTPVPDVWLRPAITKSYQPRAGGPKVARPISVAADPVLGRLAFPKNVKPNAVRVTYPYGFSGDVGGGPYDRRASVNEVLARQVTQPGGIAKPRKVTWQVGVSQEVTPVPGKLFATIAAAIAAWNAQPPGTVGVIAIMDSATYEEDLSANRIKIPEGSQLMIVAAGWPEVPKIGGAPGQMERIVGQLEPDERRPHVLGNIAATGTAPANSDIPGELDINGVLIEGKLTIEGALNGNLGRLDLSHCTLVPSKGGLVVNSKNLQLKIRVNRSICGPIVPKSPVPSISIVESTIDAAGDVFAVQAKETALEIEKATIFGRVTALQIEAGNSIFTKSVFAERRQTGCIRFSYVTASKTPRRFRCQPDLALKDAKPADKEVIKDRLVPSFTSEDYGHYAYGQLSRTCAVEITTGAEDGSEMGVFSFLRQPQRLTNLQTGLDEYLRFGLEAGVIFVT